MIYNNIRLYPFDTDEDDEEEVQLNESIRVCVGRVIASSMIDVDPGIMSRKLFLLLLSVLRTTCSSMVNLSVGARTAGEWSTSRTLTTVNLCTSATSLQGWFILLMSMNDY